MNTTTELAVVCGAGIVSGKEIMALELGDGLRADGCHVTFVTSLWGDGDFRGRLKERGIPVYAMRLGFISATLNLDCLRMTADQIWRWPKLLFDYASFLERVRPRFVIHTNWQHLLLLRPLLQTKRDVFWVHDIVPDKTQYRRVFGLLSRRLGRFVSVSNAVAESLRRIGIAEEKNCTVHNGLIDPAQGAVSPKKWSGVRIGIVGQVGAWKGHEDLLEAFAKLSPNYSDVELHIFGTNTSDFAQKLRQQAARLRITPRLVWHGFVRNRSEIFGAIDVCVAPSQFAEPFGLIAVEAAFFGLPVVASNRGGLPEIVEDGVTGFLTEAENPAKLAEKLDALLKNPELRAKMGRAARLRAQTLFNRERFVNDFVELLRERKE